MKPPKFFMQPESYRFIKTATNNFRRAAKENCLPLKNDQHLGIILNIHELLDIAKLADPDGNVVLLYGLDPTGKLTASFLGCNEQGDITPDHYTIGRKGEDGKEGEETWVNNTANARARAVQIDMTDQHFEEYMPELVINAGQTEDVAEPTAGGQKSISTMSGVTVDVSDISIRALEPYRSIVEKTIHFINLAKKLAQSGFAKFADLKLGIYFSTTELGNIQKVATDAGARGVLMLYGLAKADDPTTMTASFVAADNTDASKIQVHNYHKKDGNEGEETWTNFADCTVNGNLEKFLVTANP